MKLTPYLYIMNFISEVPEPNPFIFSLMLANQFKGKVLWCSGDFITAIDGRYYDAEGEVLAEDLDLIEWSELDRLSILESVDSYESVKWFFVEPQLTNDFCTYGLN